MNIVAHIYDEEKSYNSYVINWIKLIFFLPVVLYSTIFDRQRRNFHNRKYQGTFVGTITYDETFCVNFFDKPKTIKQYHSNICIDIFSHYYRKRLKEVYYKEPIHMTPEGDYVAHIGMKRVLEEYSGGSIITLKEFLALSNQSLSHFKHSETIKYSGR